MTIQFFRDHYNDLPNTVKKIVDSIGDIIARAEKDPYSVTHSEALLALSCYHCAIHDKGKIENIMSLDSACGGCTFCHNMRAAAENNPDIICGRCYDAAQEKYRIGMYWRHAMNLLIMSTILFSVDELTFLPAAELIRINSSGDIENVTHARNMIRYAKAHPAARVALWAKNIAAVKKAFDIEGKPQNMIFVFSSYFINKPIKRPEYADYVFTVYNDKNAVNAALASGAMECNGKKCKDCGYKCYRALWPIGANIAELLR